MIVYLVRHGETAYNRDGLGLGRRNEPLTAFGQQQAAAVGSRFSTVSLDAIFTSPLDRCRSVANAISSYGSPSSARLRASSRFGGGAGVLAAGRAV